nr:nitroreductase [Prevotella aff. ruminicola Tc2-24]
MMTSVMNPAKAQNEDYLFMIEHAIKAPSGHNTQPWKFKINDHSIDIYPDYGKALPVVDPDNRELFVSLGCATENLCVAASVKGYRSEVSVADDGVIHINLQRDTTITPSPLFPQIVLRQTNRTVYDGTIIPSDSVSTLQTLKKEPSVDVRFFRNGSHEFNMIADLIFAGNSRQMDDKQFLTELKYWMRYNKRHSDDTQDGLSYAVFGAPNLPRFISQPVMGMFLNAKQQNKGDRKKVASASHLVLFTTADNTIPQWVALGRTLERYLLRMTAMNIAIGYMNQPNEVKDLALTMTTALGLGSQYPTVLIRVGYGKRTPYSQRRPVESVLLP